MRTRFTKLVAVAALSTAGMGLAACGGGGDSGSSDGKVTVWSSTDPAVFAGLKKNLEAKAKKAGITVDVQKVDNINQLIMTKVQAGDAPDIAMIPQPGVVGDLVKRSAAKPLDDVVDLDSLKSDMTPGTLEAGTFNDKLYGLLVSMNVKSLVFYPKQAWDKAGYKAPDSIDGLNQLTDQIKSDGTTPWCFAIGSEGATGWPATDWIEDLVARYAGVDGYKKWVSHDLKFDSPEVKEAAEEMQKLVLTDGNVAGGVKSVASTAFGDADNPMWDKPPGCMMLKQGNFIVSKDFMPANIVSNVDQNIGVFGFPPLDAGGENPTVGGGDLATLLSDSDNAKKVMKMLADPTIGDDAAPSSSFISPFKTFDKSLYPNDLTRQIADVAYNSTNFLFDGSDQMPGAVGAGSFWKDMTSWISGQESLDQALKNIDSSWPSS
jgi:alpha-glucoside transport system substrate-binding protein